MEGLNGTDRPVELPDMHRGVDGLRAIERRRRVIYFLVGVISGGGIVFTAGNVYKAREAERLGGEMASKADEKAERRFIMEIAEEARRCILLNGFNERAACYDNGIRGRIMEHFRKSRGSRSGRRRR